MTDQEKNHKPRYRFSGFSDGWAKKSIGSVLSEKKRPIALLDDHEYELITVKRRNEGVVSRGHLYGRDILVKNYSQLKAGDFVISKRQVVHGATGIIPEELDGAIVSNEYLVAGSNEEISTEFLTLLSSLPAMRQKFFLSSYGVDIEKMFFDAEDWKKRFVSIPKTEEQGRISRFFKNLEVMLKRHGHQLDRLLALKYSMLQKMLPTKEATKPQIRFNEFSEPWCKKKLGEFTDSFSGGTPSVSNSSYYGGFIPFIRSAEIASTSTKLTLTELGLKNSSAKMVSKGDVLYALYGATSGEVSVARIDGAINQAILSIRPHAGFDARYLAIWLRNKKPEILGTYLQGGQGNLSGNIVKSLEVDLPCSDEQQKIASYFHHLEELISRQTIQLTKLKQIKAACLDKMFV